MISSAMRVTSADVDMASVLFAGVKSYNGLSNQSLLAKLCPDEFRRLDHPCRRLAESLLNKRIASSGLVLKSDDRGRRAGQFHCLEGIQFTMVLVRNDQLAVMAWMLSEMLANLPE